MKYSSFLTAILFVSLCSCNKNVSVNNTALSANSEASANANNIYTLTLQPGPTDGNDLWMKNWINHPSYADTCDTEVALIKGLASSYKGSEIFTRSVIKFNGINDLPAGAVITSATLYLYGPSPTSKDVKQHLPSGNSSYPGSKKGDNTCLLQRISTNWNAKTISWNNPPTTTTTDQVIVQKSDKQWQYDVALNVTAMIKTMLVNPNANKGFLLKLQTEVRPRFMGFLSSNSPEVARRPKLVVTYTL